MSMYDKNHYNIKKKKKKKTKTHEGKLKKKKKKGRVQEKVLHLFQIYLFEIV